MRTSRPDFGVAAVLLQALGVLNASMLNAQAIRGRVLEADSTPASGVVVTAKDGTGRTVARGLTSSSGSYYLLLTSNGRYEVRALRIGFEPTVIPSVDVTGGAVRDLNIVLTRKAIPIATMAILGRDDCGLHGADAVAFLKVWEQAQGALVASQLVEQSGRLDARLIRLDGAVDRTGANWDIDSLHVVELASDRPFARTLPETLRLAGYVRSRGDTSLVYDMPSADVLLSDDFVGDHCFHVERSPAAHPELIGIGFSPVRTREGAVDISGTLWLTRSAAELVRLDFSYTNLPQVLRVWCDSSRASDAPACAHMRSASSAGGYVSFVRVGTGEWLANQWMIRTPAESSTARRSSKKARIVNGVPVDCDHGFDCNRILVPMDRLGTSEFTVVDVQRDAKEIYADSRAQAFIAANAAKRAGKRPATLEGIVTDSAGQPLRRAVVQTVNPARVAFTNDSGFFQIRTLPPDTVALRVRSAGFAPVAIRVSLSPDSTRFVRMALAAALTRPPE